jgi:ParB family transcriptional regulator, chromosome partitioning protein
MGKLDELIRATGANADESMGKGTVIGTPDAGPAPSPAMPARMLGITKARNAAEIAVDRIVPDPDQPRKEFEEEALARLAESMRTRGQLQPCIVRWDEGGGVYVLICGERRWQAARRSGLATLACVIRDKPATPDELLTLQLIENVVRDDLKPIEQARAYRALIDQGWSQNRLAKELGIAQSCISDALALLDLPEPAQQLVESGRVAPSTARKVLRVEDPRRQQELIERAAAGETRAGIEAEIREASPPSTVDKTRPKGRGSKARPRKVTSRTFRAAGGKVTVDHRRGLDDATIRAMLAEAMGLLGAVEGQEAKGRAGEAA